MPDRSRSGGLRLPAIGLDTNTAAPDYIRIYPGEKETLLASLEHIQRIAARIIHGNLDGDRPADSATADAIVPLPGV